MTETKTENPKKSKILGATKSEKKDDLVRIEREYTIPLREKCRVVPRYKKTNKAVKTIKEFLARHMKVRDRDLNKIKIDKYLNELVWSRGIKHPPAKVKVKAVKEAGSDIVRVEIAEMPENLKFKKAREEKREQKAAEGVKKKVEKKTEKVEEKKTEETEEKKEEKEKKESVIEAGEMANKEAAKQSKHQVGGKTKELKHRFRQALAK